MSTPPAGWAAAQDVAAHVFVGELGERCSLTGGDGHHLRRVRRLRVGERLTAADGTGDWRRYTIVDARAPALELAADGDVHREPELEPRIAVAVPVLKKGLDGIVAALTELGVARIELVQCARAVVRWDEARGAAAITRLRVVAREAAMQARRARVPDLLLPMTLAALASRPDLVVAARGGRAAADVPLPRSGWWTVVSGPEGGFEPAELEPLAPLARLALGPHVLRATTAPVAAAAVLLARTH
jgi:16S rRNA (uracil1498-N3)-methyltransferase